MDLEILGEWKCGARGAEGGCGVCGECMTDSGHQPLSYRCWTMGSCEEVGLGLLGCKMP